MTFVRVVAFLPSAFKRIDRTNELSVKQDAKQTERVLRNLLNINGQYTVSLKNSVLTIYSSSSTLKYLVNARRDGIIAQINKRLQNVVVGKIVFKGPQQ